MLTRLCPVLQWWWLVIYAVLILPFAPYITDPTKYFRSACAANPGSPCLVQPWVCASPVIAAIMEKSCCTAEEA